MSVVLNGIIGPEGGGGGSGDVEGPASSTDNNIATFDGLTGKLIQDSGVAISSLITGSTGATDNAILIADGTGGSMLAASAATLTAAGQLDLPAGTSSVPAIISSAIDSDTGIFFKSPAGGQYAVAFVSDGSEVAYFSKAAFQINYPIRWEGNDAGIDKRNTAEVSITNGGTGIGSILASRSVEASTAGSGAPNVLTATESNKCITNEGATALAYNELPTAVAGYVFTFVVQDANGLRVTASTDDTIRVIDVVTAPAGYIESTTIGSTVTLVSINAVEWYAISITGVWTNGTWTYDDTGLTT